MKKTFVIFFLTILSSFVGFANKANKATKPSMRFQINYEGNRKENFVKLIQLQYQSIGEVIPVDTIDNIACLSSESCLSTKDYAAFHKLMFVFSNDTLYSPMFAKNAANSVYQFTVTDKEISVEDITPKLFRDDNPYAFFRISIITIIVEVIALWVVLLIFGYPDKKRFILGIFIANLISLPTYSFGIVGLLNSFIGWLIGIIFVVIFESFFIWYFMKKPASIGKMMLLVLFLNFLSMMAAGAFMFFNLMFGQTMNNWFM